MSQAKSFPGIKEHLQNTWQRLMVGLLPAFLISLLSFFAAILVIVIFAIAAVVIFTQTVGTIDINSLDKLSNMPASSYGTAAGLFILFFLILIIVGSASRAGQIMAFKSATQKFKVKDILGQAFKVVPAMVGLSLIAFFLSMGSFWLLFLPSLFVGICLVFSLYEVVLSKAGPIEAIKQSTSMVLDHFGYVVSRLLFLIAVYLAIFLVLPAMAEELGIVTAILSFFWTWFSYAYLASMYQEMKSIGYQKKSNIWWLWTMAVIGWLLFGLGFKAIMSFAGSEINKQIEQATTEMLESESDLDFDFGAEYSY